MSTGCEKNGESCITVGPVTRTAGRLAYSGLISLAVNGASRRRSYASLVSVNPRRLKAPKGDELPRDGP